jgi:hypothetical protein
MALHQTGYRVGVYFEDRVWGDETWQGQHFQKLNYIRYYGDLGKIRAKICLLVHAHPEGSRLQFLTRDQLQVEARTTAHPVPGQEPVINDPEPLFLLTPNLSGILPELSRLRGKKLIVLTPGKEPGSREIKGTAFGLQLIDAPIKEQENCLLLSGTGWGDENRIEALMLANLLGRKCLQLGRPLTQTDLVKETALPLLHPQQDRQAIMGEDYVRVLAQRLSKHLAIQPTLNLEWVMALPETGL